MPDLPPLFYDEGEQEKKRKKEMSQAEKVMSAYRRIKDTPLYQESIAFARQNRLDFFRQMVGAPTNSMGVSSVVQGQGAITLRDLPLLPTRKRRKRLRELVGSQMNDLGVPKNPIMTPGPRKPRRRKTKVIFNPTMREGWGTKLAVGAGIGAIAVANSSLARAALGNAGANIIRNTAIAGAAVGGYLGHLHAQRKARVAAAANSTNTLRTNTQGPWGARPKTPTVPSIGKTLKPHTSVSNTHPKKSHQSPKPWSSHAAALPPNNEPKVSKTPTNLKVGNIIKMKARNPKMTALIAQHAASKGLKPNKPQKPTVDSKIEGGKMDRKDFSKLHQAGALPKTLKGN